MKATFGLCLFIFLSFGLIILFLLGPLNPFEEVWRSPASFDLKSRIKTITWMTNEFAQGHLFSTFRRDLLFPEGASFFPTDVIGGTLILPFALLISPIFAYNLLIFSNLLFSCFAMFWLVYQRTRDPCPAFLAGIIFGLNPIMTMAVQAGSTEVLQTGWLPIFLWFLLKIIDDSKSKQFNKRKTILLIFFSATTWWLLTVGSNWYFGIFAGMFFCMVFLANIFSAHLRALLIRFLPVIGLFVLMILPVLYVFLNVRSSPDSIHCQLTSKFFQQPLEHYNGLGGLFNRHLPGS